MLSTEMKASVNAPPSNDAMNCFEITYCKGKNVSVQSGTTL